MLNWSRLPEVAGAAASRGRDTLAAPLTVHLSATPLATETGIWCPHCLLPSAVKTTLALAFECGTPAGSFSVTACEDCGHSEKPEL